MLTKEYPLETDYFKLLYKRFKKHASYVQKNKTDTSYEILLKKESEATVFVLTVRKFKGKAQSSRKVKLFKTEDELYDAFQKAVAEIERKVKLRNLLKKTS